MSKEAQAELAHSKNALKVEITSPSPHHCKYEIFLELSRNNED